MSNKRNFSKADEAWMARALDLAERGKGYVSPNPLVGCVIVSADGNCIGEGYHEKFGEAHAEINAINNVADKSELVDATLYVTLEPCAHSGKTPACAKELVDLPLKRVVIATEDPNPQVDGEGIKILREPGRFSVETGCLREKAERQNEAFIHYMRFGKPFVTLKMAQTADGYVAAPDGNSKWISGEASRKLVHQWRSSYDAVMVGRTTAELDNPELTVRLVEGRQPKRIILDGPLSLEGNLNVFSDQHEEKTMVLTHNKDEYERIGDPMLRVLQSDYFRGEILLLPKKEGHLDLVRAIEVLGQKQITSILVEAGSTLGSQMVKQNLVDKLHLFTAPKLLGGGTKSLLGLGINRMEEIIDLHRVSWTPSGDDMLLTGYF